MDHVDVDGVRIAYTRVGLVQPSSGCTVRRATALERPHVVGHSFGTMVALSLVRHHPALPASRRLCQLGRLAAAG